MLSPETYALRLAKARDILALSTFASRLFEHTFRGTCTEEDLQGFIRDTYSPVVLSREFTAKNSSVWLSEVAGEIAGYMKVNLNEPLPAPETGAGLEIQRLYIDLPFQGRSLGRIFIEKAEILAHFFRQPVIWLGVWEHNEKAKRFYERQGFRYFGSHPFPIGSTDQTDLWMAKRDF